MCECVCVRVCVCGGENEVDVDHLLCPTVLFSLSVSHKCDVCVSVCVMNIVLYIFLNEV